MCEGNSGYGYIFSGCGYIFSGCGHVISGCVPLPHRYPVILSIENHCSVAQQHVMADHLEAILGDMLFKEERKEDLGKLPSPEELKNKILIKVHVCIVCVCL